MSDGDGSLAVGVLGVVLASFSLAWQAATHVLTGGRVKVTLRVGGLGRGGMVTAPPAQVSEKLWEEFASQGFGRPIVAVTAANVGRQPVTVARWGLRSGSGSALYLAADSIGPPLPHRLDVGESETWAVDLAPVQAFLEVLPKLVRPGSTIGQAVASMQLPSNVVVGIVELADGRSKRSKDTLR